MLVAITNEPCPVVLETRCNGMAYTYASEDEARWARFFDALEATFAYRREGEGRHCVPADHPQFFLPEWNAFVRVQPVGSRLEKAGALLNQLHEASGVTTLLLCGYPYPTMHQVFLNGEMEDLAQFDQFAQCRRCDGVCLVTEGPELWMSVEIGPHTCGDHDRAGLTVASGFAPRLDAAYYAARHLSQDLSQDFSQNFSQTRELA